MDLSQTDSDRVRDALEYIDARLEDLWGSRFRLRDFDRDSAPAWAMFLLELRDILSTAGPRL